MTPDRTWLAWLDELALDLQTDFSALERLEIEHTDRILAAFHHVGLGQHHFMPTTGYGYGDPGREAMEETLAMLWGAESVLVRQQIVSGTQAISLCLSALVPSGGEVLFAGEPYDTLQRAVGLRGSIPGSLAERGVALRVATLPPEPVLWAEALGAQVSARTNLLYLQRSGGYSARPPMTVGQIAAVVERCKRLPAPPVIFVDNCYGEFVESLEPTQAGADLMAGSLIKNPGGGLAPCGGYVAGRRDLVERVAFLLYAPGLGGEIGPSLLSPRIFFQGLFLAPHLVGQALRGAILCARALAALGIPTSPAWNEPRTDLIQRINFGAPEPLLRFCRAMQAASPVDSRSVPEPTAMPGYDDPVIMAGGTFVQGSSSELTFDAPIRPPYIGFWQGGLSFAHARLALARCLAVLADGPPGK